MQIAQTDSKYEDLVRYLTMARETLKERYIDTELVYSLAQTNLSELETFIRAPNIAEIISVGNRCFDEGLIEAAQLLFASIGISPSTLAQLAVIGDSRRSGSVASDALTSTPSLVDAAGSTMVTEDAAVLASGEHACEAIVALADALGELGIQHLEIVVSDDNPTPSVITELCRRLHFARGVSSRVVQTSTVSLRAASSLPAAVSNCGSLVIIRHSALNLSVTPDLRHACRFVPYPPSRPCLYAFCLPPIEPERYSYVIKLERLGSY